MNVLVIPEDFRNDQHVLKPIIKAMLKSLGRPRAIVQVCMDPLLGGISQAMNWQTISEILDRYQGMVDLFLLIVDRDGQSGRRVALDDLESKAQRLLPSERHFIAENAWQEIEVWILAGHDLPPKWKWKDIRSEIDPKETYFEPFAEGRGVSDGPGQGRSNLATEAARRYDRIRSLCPEDVRNLEERIAALLQAQSATSPTSGGI